MAESPTSTGSRNRPSAAFQSFALVELYTSEGCSSCPPSDKILAGLAARGAKGEPIYCLGLHVDYFNTPDWADQFSDPRHKLRQALYRDKFKLDDVYTPQLIVNGKTQQVAARAQFIDEAVAKALAEKATHSLKLMFAEAAVAGGGAATTAGTVPPNPTIRFVARAAEGHSLENLALVLVVVQPSGESDVMGGENSGVKLKHASVVRGFEIVELPEAGIGATTIPPITPLVQGKGAAKSADKNQEDQPAGQVSTTTEAESKTSSRTAKMAIVGLPPNSQLIGFLQHKQNGQITAATALKLPNR